MHVLKGSKATDGLAEAQSEALAVDTLREVIIELRDELGRARARLLYAERMVEKLTGQSLSDGLLGS